MSSSDDPDTNTSDKCVSGERNRERERDSGIVCVPGGGLPYETDGDARRKF